MTTRGLQRITLELDAGNTFSVGCGSGLFESILKIDFNILIQLEDVHPRDPYPIEFVKVANWRTTAEKVEMLEAAGFQYFDFAQTLTKHPLYSNNVEEKPIPGFDCGSYVAICA